MVRNGSDTTSVIVSRTERGNVGVEGASSLSLTAGSCFCPFCPIPVSLHSWVIVPRPKARYPPFSKYPLPEYRGGGRNITWPPPFSLSFSFFSIKLNSSVSRLLFRFDSRFVFFSLLNMNGTEITRRLFSPRKGKEVVLLLACYPCWAAFRENAVRAWASLSRNSENLSSPRVNCVKRDEFIEQSGHVWHLDPTFRKWKTERERNASSA